jgi:phosphoadenosine phosphosulfate reductase
MMTKQCCGCGRKTTALTNTGALRPVFAEEVELVGDLTGTALMSRPRDFVLWRSGRTYYAAGRKLARVVGGGMAQSPRIQILAPDLLLSLNGRRPGPLPRWLSRGTDDTIAQLARSNAPHITAIEEEAISFLRSARDLYAELPLAVSWSGGKDSTVVSLLAQQAFPRERVVHIFADTTIELPCTSQYLSDFRAACPGTPFLVSLPSRDFLPLAREIGPPSHIQRWCCTTQKAAPLSNALRAIATDGWCLVISGLRRQESIRRQDYRRVIEDGKIGLQILANPIIDWSEFEVWTWTIISNAPVNSGYRYGLDRIGCAFCPDSSPWSYAVSRVMFPEYFAGWEDLLVEVARSAGVSDPAAYVSSGAWKSRRGGGIGSKGLPNAKLYEVRSRPCTLSDCATFYETAIEYDAAVLFELLKPFGSVKRNPLGPDLTEFGVSGRHGTFTVLAAPRGRYLRVIFDTPSTQRKLEGTIRLQVRKLQACVGCGGCASRCPAGAIVSVGNEYRIAEDRCHCCLACVRGLKAGCIAAHSLNAKAVETVG